MLRAPRFDYPWYLITDASGGAIGGWLGQRHNGALHPVMYHSRQLKPHEKKWALDSYEAECLAIIDSLKKFKPFIYGSRIIILSDSRALQWLFTKPQYKSPRLTRWALSVAGFGADVLHLPGNLNKPADCLSRYPLLSEPSQPQATDDSSSCQAGKHISPKRLSPQKLGLVKDKEERQLLTHDELIVDGDPTVEGTITLISLARIPVEKAPAGPAGFLNSLRTNTPDVTASDDPVIWSAEEICNAQRKDSLLKHIINYLNNPTPFNI